MIYNEKRFSLPIKYKQNINTKNEDFIENKIKVFCRLKPYKNKEKNIYKIQKELGIIEIDDLEIKNSNQMNNKKFIFSEIFDENMNQEEIFKKIGINVILELFEKNQDSLIFSYGVTNAGKTYTILGNKQNKGILYRLLYKLFEIKNHFLNEEKYNLSENENNLFISRNSFLSFLEFNDNYSYVDLDIKLESFQIYNEQVYDLFTKNKNNNNKQLKVREFDKKIIIENWTEKFINNIKDIEKDLWITDKNRIVSSTGSNLRSSRSHTVYKIKLEFKYKNEIETIIWDKNIIVIDLAGSERLKKTFNKSINLIEANNINKSLLVLGKCLKCMANKQNVPFRESKWTRILSEFFSGNHLIRMIVNINPDPKDLEESLRVLNYSSIAREVKIVTQKIKKNKPKNLVNFNPENSIKFFETNLLDQEYTIKKTNELKITNKIENKNEILNNDILNKIFYKLENIEQYLFDNNKKDDKQIKNNKVKGNKKNKNNKEKEMNIHYFSELSTKEQIKIIKKQKLNHFN